MVSLYCSQRHENPTGSRFCHLCGEKLQAVNVENVYAGMILSDRYRILRELGHGGFGRTYLAEDNYRFNEPCVLKEFAPQVQGTYALQKAEELFEREAGVLYKLKHPQIPAFRELFRAQINQQGRLFLVQDYVEGQTFHALLENRRYQRQRFSESEVTQLLRQILPVLDYIHSLGVVHRDISPDNLILRHADGLPVLIDFGGVKQVAATVASQFTAQAPGNYTPSSATRLGKIGYAPDEQLQMGVAYPHSDLYALAVTVLVLLTAKEPQDLLDGHTLTWNWRREVTLSPLLGAILDKMLAHRPSDRYQSVREVLQALDGYSSAPAYVPPLTPAPAPTPPVTQNATVAVAPVATPSPIPPVPVPQPARRQGFGFSQLLLLLLVIVFAGSTSWWVSNRWLDSRDRGTPVDPVPSPTASEPPPNPQFSTEEQARKEALGDRRRNLGIDYNFFVRLANQSFYAQNPNLDGRQLSAGPEDADLRAQWDQTANQLLDQLETLSGDVRQRLGSYTSADRDRWKATVNRLNLSSRALYDLADAKFFSLFPEQRDQDFINQPIGQVWHAIAADQLKAVQSGTALEKIQIDSGSFSQQVNGNLAPGEGKAYIANLSKDQLVRLNLQPTGKTQLSIYPPTSSSPPLLVDSTETSWSGTLTQSGFYEFVITSTASDPISYQLDLTVENVTSTPPNPPSPPSLEPSPESSPEPADTAPSP